MKRTTARSILAAVSAFTLTFASQALCAGPYVFHVTDLGIPSGDTASYAWGINNSGQVVGYGQDSTMMSPQPPRFLSTTSNGAFTPLGADRGAGAGLAINDSGQVTGFNGLQSYHAVRLNPGDNTTTLGTDLGTLGGSISDGQGINASGQVVGWSYTSGGLQHAFRTTATGAVSDPNTDLGTLGGSLSIAFGINAAGQAVGNSSLPNGHEHAFRTSPTGLVSTAGADLGSLPGRPDSFAQAINASGQVAGYSSDASMMGMPPHAFRTTATGDLTSPSADLGTLLGDTFSSAYAINDNGWVVGVSGGHAMLEDGITMYDLATLLDGSGAGWQLSQARGINNSDQIIVFATNIADQMTHGIRLDPVSVPEPSTIMLLCTSSVGFCLAVRRRDASLTRRSREIQGALAQRHGASGSIRQFCCSS
jgi:probable HAF family extracellular repeat protein